MGKSETIGQSDSLFLQVDKKLRVYSKSTAVVSKTKFDMSVRYSESLLSRKKTSVEVTGKIHDVDLERAADSFLLKKYTPASVIVNNDLDII